MGQRMSLDMIISSLDYNCEDLIEDEGDTMTLIHIIEGFTEDRKKPKGNCAFDKIFMKNVPHILEKIVFSLDYETYNRCSEVNKNWKDLLTSNSYQGKAKILYQEELIEKEIELCHASENGSVSQVCQIPSCVMVNVNCRNGSDHDTPLFKAVREGHLDSARWSAIFCLISMPGGVAVFLEHNLAYPAIRTRHEYSHLQNLTSGATAGLL